MSNAKNNLLAEIDAKIKRKKQLREEIANRGNNVEAFALAMINDVEDMIASTVNTSLVATLAPLYAKSFEGRVQTLDPGCKVEVQWITANDVPRINHILITWSKEYQTENNCEEQLCIDTTALLFQ